MADSSAAAGTAGPATAMQVHVGGNERGDVQEAEMLRAAVDARSSPALSLIVTVHAGKDHNVVTALRNAGALHDLLQELIAPSQSVQTPVVGGR